MREPAAGAGRSARRRPILPPLLQADREHRSGSASRRRQIRNVDLPTCIVRAGPRVECQGSAGRIVVAARDGLLTRVARRREIGVLVTTQRPRCSLDRHEAAGGARRPRARWRRRDSSLCPECGDLCRRKPADLLRVVRNEGPLFVRTTELRHPLPARGCASRAAFKNRPKPSATHPNHRSTNSIAARRERMSFPWSYHRPTSSCQPAASPAGKSAKSVFRTATAPARRRSVCISTR